ncbi:MFS transporter [Sphingomonadaceae bacterium G21617-S1]|nr:MFS transporter [Sphingomonadaceae bacterium G21617-S1]
MIALIPAEITCSLESTMMYAALAKLYALYGDPAQIGWLITAFTLAAAGSAAIGGRLGDMFGRRRMLCILLVLSCVGSLLSASTDDLRVVIAGRILQGMTMAILPLCFGILRENLPLDRTALGVSILGSIFSAMVGIGALLGGLIIDNFEWQMIFRVSAAMGAISLVAALLVVPRSVPAGVPERLDLAGGLLFVPALAATLYGVTEGGRQGWMGLPGLYVAAGVTALIFWARYELRHSHPLLDLRLFRNRQIRLVAIGIFLAAVGPMTSSLIIFPLLQQPEWTGTGFGLSASMAGAIKLPGALASGLFILASGLIMSRVGIRIILLAGTAVTLMGWLGMIFGGHSLWWLVALIIFALTPGAGLVNAIAPQVIVQHAPQERIAEATGLLIVIRTMGNSIGAQIVAICLATRLVSEPGRGQFPAESAYLVASVVIAFLTIGSGIAFSGLAGRKSGVVGSTQPELASVAPRA